MIDVIDALVELVEPADPVDPTKSVNGITIDRSCAQPLSDAAANTLYAWEEACRESPMGTGEVRQDFNIVLLFAVDNEGEDATAVRKRSVSEALDTKRKAWMKTLRLHANVPPWDSGNIQATSDADFLRQFATRGIAVRVAGYRLVTEA